MWAVVVDDDSASASLSVMQTRCAKTATQIVVQFGVGTLVEPRNIVGLVLVSWCWFGVAATCWSTPCGFWGLE